MVCVWHRILWPFFHWLEMEYMGTYFWLMLLYISSTLEIGQWFDWFLLLSLFSFHPSVKIGFSASGFTCLKWKLILSLRHIPLQFAVFHGTEILGYPLRCGKGQPLSCTQYLNHLDWMKICWKLSKILYMKQNPMHHQSVWGWDKTEFPQPLGLIPLWSHLMRNATPMLGPQIRYFTYFLLALVFCFGQCMFWAN